VAFLEQHPEVLLEASRQVAAAAEQENLPKKRKSAELKPKQWNGRKAYNQPAMAAGKSYGLRPKPFAAGKTERAKK